MADTITAMCVEELVVVIFARTPATATLISFGTVTRPAAPSPRVGWFDALERVVVEVEVAVILTG